MQAWYKPNSDKRVEEVLRVQHVGGVQFSDIQIGLKCGAVSYIYIHIFYSTT